MRRGAALVLAAALVAAIGCGGAPAAASQVEVRDAFAPAGTTALAVYLEVGNRGGPDAIVGAELLGPDVDLARSISLHRSVDRDGFVVMEPAQAIDVPGGTDDAIGGRSGHIMLEDVSEQVEVGRTISMRLSLRRGPDVTTRVRVVGPDEAVALLVGEAP